MARRAMEARAVSRGERVEAGEANREAERLESEPRQEQHAAHYRELLEKSTRGEVEFRDSTEDYVRVDDILEPERAGETSKADTPEFWTRHGNTPEFYDEMGHKYPELRERLARGETVEELKKNGDLRVATEFWYGKPVKLEKYRGSYFIDAGYHRYHLGRKFNLGEIPATVKEAHDKQ